MRKKSRIGKYLLILIVGVVIGFAIRPYTPDAIEYVKNSSANFSTNKLKEGGVPIQTPIVRELETPDDKQYDMRACHDAQDDYNGWQWSREGLRMAMRRPNEAARKEADFEAKINELCP